MRETSHHPRGASTIILGAAMDSRRFDRLTRLLPTSSRRDTVRLLLGSVLGGQLPVGTEPTEAKTRTRGATTTERCLSIGEKCPKTLKHGRKPKRHSCEQGCCTRYAETGADGTRRCACRPTGAPCTAETARHCCQQVCTGGVCGTTSIAPPPMTCPSGTVMCGGACVNLQTDPRNCGSCGTRCQGYATCTAGVCGCFIGDCGDSKSSCCAVGSACACIGGTRYLDPTTCRIIDDCPAERQCIGPDCRTCCPVGSTCDPTTGTCLH